MKVIEIEKVGPQSWFLTAEFVFLHRRIYYRTERFWTDSGVIFYDSLGDRCGHWYSSVLQEAFKLNVDYVTDDWWSSTNPSPEMKARKAAREHRLAARKAFKDNK